VEVVIGTGLCGALALIIGDYMSGIGRQFAVSKSRNLRMEIAESIRKTASSDVALKFSAQYGVGNDYFRPCIFQWPRTAISSCRETTTFLPMFLYEVNPAVMPKPDVANPPFMLRAPAQVNYISGASLGTSGNNETPRRYRADGSACPLGSPASRECPIEVVTQFIVKQSCGS